RLRAGGAPPKLTPSADVESRLSAQQSQIAGGHDDHRANVRSADSLEGRQPSHRRRRRPWLRRRDQCPQPAKRANRRRLARFSQSLAPRSVVKNVARAGTPIVALTLLLCASFPEQHPVKRSDETALDRYIAAPDSNFSFRKAGMLAASTGVTASILELTSQAWFPHETDAR